MNEFDFEEIKKRAISDFKRRNKELEAWLMKPVSEYKDGKGIFEQFKKDALGIPCYVATRGTVVELSKDVL